MIGTGFWEWRQRMKIAYGTYAMPTVPLEEGIPALAQMGYQGVEIAIGPKHHQSLPDQISPARRKELKKLLTDHGMGVPALFILGSVLTDDATQHQKTMDLTRQVAQLARDLGMRHPPVLAIGLGGKSKEWESRRNRMVEVLRDYAGLAEREDFILAGEAHCNAAVDRSERVVWLFSTVNHPRIRFHFDIVHMFLAGEKIEDSVRALVPYTAHTHITDARRHPDGKFDLLLLGQGQLDSVAYVKAMHEAGWKDFITLEVSTLVWSKPGYDWSAAAKFCYATLDNAFRQAGVPRT
ncbi:MAG: sugar phosphate isomerase/epimerase [Planctomycetes bacterium]|nr:sugar phosphate isomerase/epimerase [Planctomycetota bacterium]